MWTPAAALIDRMAPHLDPAWLLSLRVRLAALCKDGEAAGVHMLTLCGHEDANPEIIQLTAGAMTEAGLEDRLARSLEKALTLPVVNLETGPTLVRLHGSKSTWDHLEDVLGALDPATEVWSHLAAAYVDTLLEKGEGQRLIDFIAEKDSELRNSDHTWGAVAMV